MSNRASRSDRDNTSAMTSHRLSLRRAFLASFQVRGSVLTTSERRALKLDSASRRLLASRSRSRSFCRLDRASSTSFLRSRREASCRSRFSRSRRFSLPSREEVYTGRQTHDHFDLVFRPICKAEHRVVRKLMG